MICRRWKCLDIRGSGMP